GARVTSSSGTTAARCTARCRSTRTAIAASCIGCKSPATNRARSTNYDGRRRPSHENRSRCFMKIKKGSPGLDQRNRLGRVLGAGFVVEDYDATRPLAAQVGDADVLLVRDVPITREVIDAAVHLKLIQRPGDHLPR